MVQFENVASVDDHPTIPGASVVRYHDGSSMLAPSSVAGQFDPRRLSLQASGATAQNMSLVPPTASLMGQAQLQSQPQAQDFRATPVNAPAPSSPPQNFAPPPVFNVPTAAEQQVATSRDPIDPDTGLRLSALGRVYDKKYVDGRAAYDPTADDARRKAVRETSTEHRVGVQAWDEEAQANNLINHRTAIQAQGEAESLKAQSDLQAQRLLAQDQAKTAHEQQQQQAAQESVWKQEQAHLVAQATALNNREIEPNRVFSSNLPWQGIGLALAAALKGWASRGQDNSVAETVNRMIDRDVAAQQDQIHREKGDIDNALARNMQRYGSVEAGRAATKAAMQQAALARFDANRLAMGMPAADAARDATRQKLEADLYASFEQLKSAAQGTTTTAVASSMRAPVAGVSGGWRAPTENEIAQRMSREQGYVGQGVKNIGERLTNEQKEQDLLTGGGPQAVENEKLRTEHLGKGMSELSAMRNHVDQITSLAGITEDKEGNAHHNGIPGVGVGYNVAAANPLISHLLGGEDTAKAYLAQMINPKGGRIRTASLELLTAKIKDATGSAFSEQEAARHASALAQGLSQGEDAYAQAVVDFRRSLAAKELELKSAAGKSATDRYKRDKAAISQEEAVTRSGIRGGL
jgi:hypothetical protein